MASLLSHPAFPVALLISKARPFFSRKLFILCVLLTLLPDADVISFKFGIPYESQWGHRGFTHSFTFAVLLGIFCSAFSLVLDSTPKRIFFTTFLSTLSHCVFDALTNGGLGVAFFWPFSSERYFLPFHPIEVSPIGVKNFLTMRGVQVVLSELMWIWLPCILCSQMFKFRKIL
jgi:inner membrane protein